MKKKYRITNWKEYNSALKKRGSLTLWVEEGFMVSLFTLLKITLMVPEFSRLSRRMAKALSSIRFPSLKENIYIILNSSGLKVYGEKEWLKTKKGKTYARRVWRKIDIEVDAKGFIHASQMTDHKTADRSCVPSLLEEAGPDFIEEVLGDTGYDGHKVDEYCHQKNIIPIIPPPKNAKVHSKKDYLAIRNEAVNYIKEKKINVWKNKHNFGRRNRVENTFYRIKTIFGRSYASRKWENQKEETRLLCHLLNQITTLGMPKAVKIA